jgi:carboxyl-terminal processing protease
MDKFTAQNVKGVVIDLRFNPGGLLQQAVETAQMFVPRGGEIVETRPRSPKQATPYFSRNPKPYTLPLVVLVNGGSASASEIFAGAIQDHDLGLVVGTLSYGKGSVQSLFPLSGGKALKLTTAKWYTPSGRCIHKDEGERDLVDAEDIDTVGDDGAAGDDVPAKKADRPKYKTLVRNRVVYGGGGITPDVEVKPEPLTAFENKVEGRGLFFTFAVSYAAQHKGVTAATPVTDDMVNQVLDLARKEKIEFTTDEATRDRSYVERAIRREIARRVAGDEAAFRVQMEGDKQLAEAVDLLSTYKTTARLLDYAVAHPSASEAATR